LNKKLKDKQENEITLSFREADYARAILANYYMHTYSGNNILLSYGKASLKEAIARNSYARMVNLSVMEDLEEYLSTPYSSILEDWRQRLVCDQNVIDAIEITKEEMAAYSTVALRTKNLFDLNRAKSILKSDQLAFKTAWPKEPFEKALIIVVPTVSPRGVSPRGSMFPIFSALTANCSIGKLTPENNNETSKMVTPNTTTSTSSKNASENTVVDDDDPPLQKKPSLTTFNAKTDRR
jgi:hypothetical protein